MSGQTIGDLVQEAVTSSGALQTVIIVPGQNDIYVWREDAARLIEEAIAQPLADRAMAALQNEEWMHEVLWRISVAREAGADALECMRQAIGPFVLNMYGFGIKRGGTPE